MIPDTALADADRVAGFAELITDTSGNATGVARSSRGGRAGHETSSCFPGEVQNVTPPSILRAWTTFPVMSPVMLLVTPS